MQCGVGGVLAYQISVPTHTHSDEQSNPDLIQSLNFFCPADNVVMIPSGL